MAKILSAAIAAAYALVLLSPQCSHAMNTKPIKERKKHFRIFTEALGISQSQLARMAGGYHNRYPLNYQNTLRNTRLEEHIILSNNGEDISEVYVDGFYDMSTEAYKEYSAKLPPTEIIAFYWDLWHIKRNKRFFGMAVDRNIHFRRLIATRYRLLPIHVNSSIVLISMWEDLEKQIVSLENISIGKHEQLEKKYTKRAMQGKGLMRPIFMRLEHFLRKNYKGWTLHIDARHRTTKVFANIFPRLPKKDRYLIDAPRMSAQEFLTVAEAIRDYIANRLHNEGPFLIDDVHKVYHDVNVKLIDTVIYSQFETSREMIVRRKDNPARLSMLIDDLVKALQYTQTSA